MGMKTVKMNNEKQNYYQVNDIDSTRQNITKRMVDIQQDKMKMVD
jgi:predicted enzyme related to lactoylglutathione lyase